MKLVIIAASLCLGLVGCGTFFKPNAVAGIECEGARCDAIWSKAQSWLAVNSRYRIQIANDNVIQTYGPHEYVYDAVAYTITKERSPNGKTLIAIHGSCYPTVYGCAYDPAPITNRLFYELEAVK